jgi:uncharacterized damage-inducible protein DinB
MENALQLANRFKDVILDGKWIAYTNYKDQLSTIDLQVAAHKIGNLNTIAALTFHINYYIEGINKVFEGGDLLIRDKYSFDLPVLQTEDQWRKMIDTLVTNSEAFYNHVKDLPAERLEEPFVKEAYGNYRRNIEGVIEHSYYHLGQLVIIRKLVEAERSA